MTTALRTLAEAAERDALDLASERDAYKDEMVKQTLARGEAERERDELRAMLPTAEERKNLHHALSFVSFADSVAEDSGNWNRYALAWQWFARTAPGAQRTLTSSAETPRIHAAACVADAEVAERELAEREADKSVIRTQAASIRQLQERLLSFQGDAPDFASAARPLIRWMNSVHPHHTAIVTATYAELVVGEQMFRTEEYLRDKAPKVEPTTFADALRIARGCTDYGGGHSGAAHEAYQHGIRTVIQALEGARRDDTQTAALLAMGGERSVPVAPSLAELDRLAAATYRTLGMPDAWDRANRASREHDLACWAAGVDPADHFRDWHDNRRRLAGGGSNG